MTLSRVPSSWRIVLCVMFGTAVSVFASAAWREGATCVGRKSILVKTEAALLYVVGWIPLFKSLRRRRPEGTGSGEPSNAGQSDRKWPLSTRLFSWSKRDHVTLADLTMGTQIWGSSGAGKSTGSLAMIVRAFLTSPARFGGVFLTCKPEDRNVYERFVRESGRSEDLILFGPDHPQNTYNFIADELSQQGGGLGLTDNLTTLLCTVAEISQRSSGKGDSREDGSFWTNMFKSLCKNASGLLVLAKGTVSVSDMYALVLSAPTSFAEIGSEEWRKRSFCFECLREADAKKKTPVDQSDFELITAFFVKEWPGLSDRTRSVVCSSFTSTLDVLNRGVVKQLMSNPKVTIRPSMACEGKLIIIDMPVMVYKELGQYVQVIWKFCFQRAMSRRAGSDHTRPTFIVCDESHLLTVPTDQIFQTTARSTRTCVVNATQSISNYLAAFGGEKSEPEVHSLLGNLQTQIFHQQTDIRTNQYAAELIGKTRKILCNSSNSYQRDGWPIAIPGMGENGQTTAGASEHIDYEVQHSVFTTLSKGGPPSWEVDGIVYQGGRRFEATGKTWMPVRFKQSR